MRLGNSNGNNKGKKYLMRSKLNTSQEPAQENKNKAERFNQWFEKNYQNVINFLISKYSFHEDVFYNTYIRMAEQLLYTDTTINDYKGYFIRSYFTNHIQEQVSEKRYVALPSGDRIAAHHHNPYERERMQLDLENEIFNYVYNRYDLREFELFKMYVTLKPAINYHSLSAITHIKTHVIQRIVSTILSDIRANKKLLDRYKTIL